MPRCSQITEQKLQDRFVGNTKKILKKGAIDQREIASPLIHECKEIFFATESTEDIRMDEEYESEKTDMKQLRSG